KKLAPKSLLISSGTIDRSHGVLFSLHPSTQDSYQKSRQFVCQFAVPANFRADYVQVNCTAYGVDRGMVRSLDNEVSAGVARYTVGIYLEGDAQAKQAGELVADCQQDLIGVLAQEKADAIERAKSKHWWNSISLTSHRKVAVQVRKPVIGPDGTALAAP